MEKDLRFEELKKMYNTDGHVFVINGRINFNCKYCFAGLIERNDIPKCISDEEKIIKDLLE